MRFSSLDAAAGPQAEKVSHEIEPSGGQFLSDRPIGSQTAELPKNDTNL